MSDPDRAKRIARQHLDTESLFGLKDVPIALADLAASGAASQETPRTSAPGDVAEKTEALKVLDERQVHDCQKCALASARNNTVFGQGSADARLVFVGEAPGFEEDRQGLAFVGRAGQLLTKMIQAMTLTREEVFICNVLKCRPPENRDPAPDEITACSPYLMEQLRVIDPEVIVALGAPAARTLLDTNEGIGRLRGRFHDFYIDGPMSGCNPIPLMPTYHPAYLLRSPDQKAKAWADLQQVMALLGLQRG
jgi:DNA polymerase